MSEYMRRHGLRIFRNGYEVIPIKPGGKFPVIDQWQKLKIDEKTVQRWQLNGHGSDGIGIRTRYSPMLDVDCYVEDFVDSYVDWTDDNIGIGLIRTGQPPKVA